MFLKLHNTTNCFKFSESFTAFWTSKKFQQWSFQKNSRKIIIKISTSGETQRGLGSARGATSGPGGQLARPSPWPRPQGAWGPRDPPPGMSSSSLSLFLQKPEFCTCSCVLAVLGGDSSISLYSPSFELKFWANTPWYVTPPPLQLDFWLVASFVSI